MVDADANGSDFVYVPYAVLPELAAGRFTWLDERQCIVQAFSEAEWPGLVERARRFTNTPTQRSAANEPKKMRKGWWPF